MVVSRLLLNKLKFKLHDGSGNEWKLISGKQAVSHILKANEFLLTIRIHERHSKKSFAPTISI